MVGTMSTSRAMAPAVAPVVAWPAAQSRRHWLSEASSSPGTTAHDAPRQHDAASGGVKTRQRRKSLMAVEASPGDLSGSERDGRGTDRIPEGLAFVCWGRDGGRRKRGVAAEVQVPASAGRSVSTSANACRAIKIATGEARPPSCHWPRLAKARVTVPKRARVCKTDNVVAAYLPLTYGKVICLPSALKAVLIPPPSAGQWPKL